MFIVVLIVFSLIVLSFLALSLVSLFNPKVGGFWLKYIKIENTKRLNSFLCNFVAFLFLSFIYMFLINPDKAYNQGMAALNRKDFAAAIEKFSQISESSSYYNEKQKLIDRAKNEARQYYNGLIKNSIANLDEASALSYINHLESILGESNIKKEKLKTLIFNEATKQRNEMLKLESEEKYEEAKKLAEKLQKLEKFSNEAQKKIAFYNDKLAQKKAEEEMIKKLREQEKAYEERVKKELEQAKFSEKKQKEETQHVYPTIGGILRTQYFEVTLNDVYVTSSINTGDLLLGTVYAGEGNRFLVLYVTFKNIDTESRMPTEGRLFIHYGGKEYMFDKTEPILAKGWGLFFEQLNPFTKISTKIVYKIPEDLSGIVYWQPGRAEKRHRFVFKL